MKQRVFTSARAKEALLPDKDKYCGGCCWFYGEDTDGHGLCVNDDLPFNDRYCGYKGCGNYVSREKMRHHMKVLLTVKYWFEGNHRHGISPHELHEAMVFAYKYMKVFSKL